MKISSLLNGCLYISLVLFVASACALCSIMSVVASSEFSSWEAKARVKPDQTIKLVLDTTNDLSIVGAELQLDDAVCELTDKKHVCFIPVMVIDEQIPPQD